MQPPPESATDPAQTRQEDLKAISAFLNKDKPAGISTPARQDPHQMLSGGVQLPPDHPPLPGAASTAGKTGEEIPGLPQGHPPISPGAMAAAGQPASSAGDAVSFTAPSAWKQEQVRSSMRKAQYVIPHAAPDAEDGEMVVFYFGPGQGGAVEANIDRWKGMFSTPDGKPVPEAAVRRESREIDGLKVTTLDVSGRYVDPMSGKDSASKSQDWRMLSAIVETPQGPWFFKGVGPVATMKAHEQNFETFVESIRRRQ